jgi:hypothetical protein
MAEIGETLMELTKVRFQTSTAPDGGRWAPNAQTTLLSYLSGKGAFSKTGVVSGMPSS